MEPQLISRKAIKKILKKNYFIEESYFNKSFNSVINKVKLNWLPIVIILVAIGILIHLYIENKNKKDLFQKNQDELKQLEKLENETRSDEFDDYKSKSNYESEYYKMLPKVINNPEVMPYQY